MKIHPPCECRESEHYYRGCFSRATLRVLQTTPGKIGIFRKNILVCEKCSSIYNRDKVTVTNIEEEQ